MDIALLLIRLLLAGVFAVAGFAKLADLPGSRRALADFGLGTALAKPVGLTLPLAELAVAVALLPSATAWWGGAGALVLLVLFIAGIAANLARGRRPDCHCFGQLHSAPAGWPTVLRNVAFAGLAACVVWLEPGMGGLSAVGLLAGLPVAGYFGLAGGLVLLAFVSLEAWMLLHLLRQNGRLMLRVEALEDRLGLASIASAGPAVETGLPVGAPAPAFHLPDLTGELISLDELRSAGKPLVLLFSDPECGPCNAILPEVGRWQREQGDKLTVVPISRGPVEMNRAKSAEHGLTRVLLETGRELIDAYQVAGTPSAVLVRPDGTIGSTLAAGPDAIRALVERDVLGIIPLDVLLTAPSAEARNGHQHHHTPRRPSLQRGDPAPEIRLPGANGEMLELASFRGEPTALLFWNPRCGFCQGMLDDLKQWEFRPGSEAPRLLLISTGTAGENREMGLRSPIMLDEGFAVGRAFGAEGTPAATLIDARGFIASDLVVGADAALNLLWAGGAKAPATR